MRSVRQGARNGRVGVALGVIVAAMLGLSFAAVPLYRVFCAATGYGGTPQLGGIAPGQQPDGAMRTINVRFDANTAPGLPWRFQPEQAELRVRPGQDQPAFYRARNEGGEAVTGVATYNVSPEKAARYFHKTACFCFNQQTLAPGQEAEFPLSFWVDPAVATDPAAADVTTITLSYTFFRSPDDALRSKHGPHVGPRADLAP